MRSHGTIACIIKSHTYFLNETIWGEGGYITYVVVIEIDKGRYNNSSETKVKMLNFTGMQVPSYLQEYI